MSNPGSETGGQTRKRVALFLDGTWNTVGDNTNVWRLKALCAARSNDGARQVVYYSKGVGTNFGEKVRGGMLGYGLDRAITEVYEWLVEAYEPGDEIFIFGFSRGAYTARSLAGFIAKCGLLRPGAALGVAQLFERYRKDDTVPTIRQLAEMPAPVAAKLGLEERWMLADAMPVPIKMVGVWDTVGALGIPFGNIPGLSRSGFKFLHTGLRVPLENAYHAVAVDEHRQAFAPTLWTKKIRDGVPANELAAPRPIASVEQRWFVGAHANVGGGCRSDLLAQRPLQWLMQKAEGHGLAFRGTVEPGADMLRAAISDSFREFAWGLYAKAKLNHPFYRIIGEPPRLFPGGHDEIVNETIDASVFDRWRADAAYRPQNLADWARRYSVDPAALTRPVLTHEPSHEVAA
ncbi:MAG: DUF2235 domain-containing protein [Rhodocyclaceae bacterium]|nr:MAG: DUF2235 domain-containing protein [Rhodocyclaceae bacterium]